MGHKSETFSTARPLCRAQHWFLMLLAMMAFVVAGPAMAGRTNGGLTGGFAAPVLAPASGLPAQFDMVGFMQEATVAPVGSMCPTVTDPRLMGGTVTINGLKIIVPCNTILQMPAFTATWADLFTLGPKDITPIGTGLALSDPVTPGTIGLLNSGTNPYNAALPSNEFHVVGNLINGQYIAGLIDISQQSFNGSQGVISCIDYLTGEMQVGGTLQPHGAACPTAAQIAASGQKVARVRMNDPDGRFGITHGGPGSGADVEEIGYDIRFSADTENPTMFSTLGVPICIPRINPFAGGGTTAGFAPGVDLLCPLSNRPVVPNCKSFDPLTGLPAFGAQAPGFCTTYVMDPPGTPAPIDPATGVRITCPGPSVNGVSCPTDPTRAVPLVIGDTISFNGTLKADATGPYISAHTIAANLGIYTHPHTKPSYIAMEGMLVGSGGQIVGGLAQEGTSKVSWEGMASDPTELVDFFALHQDPATGAVTDFYLGTQDPCCKPLGRFRTPANNQGAFGDPTRYYRAVSRNACQPSGINGPFTAPLQTICHLDPLTAPDATAKVADQTPTANDLVPGRYLLPNFEYIFPENLNFGTPLVPNNFQDLPFLFCGSGPIEGPGSGTAIVGQLDPAPWAPPMPDPFFAQVLCPNAPKVGATTTVAATAGPKPAVINSVTATPATATVGLLTTVTLTASATDPNTPATAMSYAWTVPAGVVMSCGVCAPNANNATVRATFNATAAGTLTFRVTVSNGVLPAATGSAVVTVLSANVKPPRLKGFVATPTSVNGRQLVTLVAVGNADPTAPAPAGTVTFSFRQTGGPAVTINPITVTGIAPADQTAKATFIAPCGAASQLTFQATVTNSSGVSTVSNATQVRVSVAATACDTVTINAVNWQNLGNVGGTLTQRGKLSITASSTANPAPVGMTMTATYFNSSLPATVPGSSALPLTTPLTLVVDPLICPSAAPCWTVLLSNVIQDTSVTPAVMVPPTTVTVTSSLGGTATATGAAIVIR